MKLLPRVLSLFLALALLLVLSGSFGAVLADELPIAFEKQSAPRGITVPSAKNSGLAYDLSTHYTVQENGDRYI